MGRFLSSIALASLLIGCATTAPSPKRAAAAKAAFDRITKELHLPSSEATASKKAELLAQAASSYENLLHQFSDQPFWCAQALRSLGNVHAEQGKLDQAIRHYARVGEKYPREEWEVLQAWKTAGDLLWEAKRTEEAKKFYTQLVNRFDTPTMPAIVKIVVNAAKKRLVTKAD